jgi:putative transposase
MPNYVRMRVPGGAYFLGLNLQDRREGLLLDHIDELRQAFRNVKETRPFHVDAIVILPDHLHCVMTLPPGDTDYSTRIALIKGNFTRAIPKTELISASRRNKRERGVWQRRYWEHTIRDEDDYERHIDYIHYNPVKHGYTDTPSRWKHSSIHRFISTGILSESWSAARHVQALNFETRIS